MHAARAPRLTTAQQVEHMLRYVEAHAVPADCVQVGRQCVGGVRQIKLEDGLVDTMTFIQACIISRSLGVLRLGRRMMKGGNG